MFLNFVYFLYAWVLRSNANCFSNLNLILSEKTQYVHCTLYIVHIGTHRIYWNTAQYSIYRIVLYFGILWAYCSFLYICTNCIFFIQQQSNITKNYDLWCSVKSIFLLSLQPVRPNFMYSYYIQHCFICWPSDYCF